MKCKECGKTMLEYVESSPGYPDYQWFECPECGWSYSPADEGLDDPIGEPDYVPDEVPY